MSIKKLAWIFVMLALLTTLLLIIISRISISSDVIFGGADGVFINADGLLDPLDGYDIKKTNKVEAPSDLIYPKLDVSGSDFIIVNEDNPVGSYSPELGTVGMTGVRFARSAVKALEKMLADAKVEGYTPYISCGYRSYNSQSLKFNGKARQIVYGGRFDLQEALELAKDYVEYPGCSEHQTGLAVDIADKEYAAYDEQRRDNALYLWLDAHCADYGFIKRYPQTKSDLTGRDEYWHYRYVGKEAAAFIMENGLCLEEFLAHYAK